MAGKGWRGRTKERERKGDGTHGLGGDDDGLAGSRRHGHDEVRGWGGEMGVVGGWVGRYEVRWKTQGKGKKRGGVRF